MTSTVTTNASASTRPTPGTGAPGPMPSSAIARVARRAKDRPADHTTTPRRTSRPTAVDPSRDRAVREELECLLRNLMSVHHPRTPEA
ncbi:hypothetical protein ACFVDI_15365 [Nocardioides sp. NPDC057767]|uniref:hypothetical protein n=1 Tax=unclassified Nocardioides TaxID=2615069 RepID=UPI003671C8A6